MVFNRDQGCVLVTLQPQSLSQFQQRKATYSLHSEKEYPPWRPVPVSVSVSMMFSPEESSVRLLDLSFLPH